MAIHRAEDLTCAPWRASAAYLYTLDLDGPALAWEYLRRHPRYRADWGRRRFVTFRRWGLRSAEDPRLDAREVQPAWALADEDLLHVRAMRAPGTSGQPAFDLWRVPGRKRLVPGDAGLTLRVDASAQRVRVSLADDLVDGAAYACAVPLSPALRGQLDVFSAQARLLRGHAAPVAASRPATRTALLHLRALQALDAAQAGVSQRDIAQALFGAEVVTWRWSDDGELRAQVRHLLRRAQGYMDGGYLALARIPRTVDELPGDEPMR